MALMAVCTLSAFATPVKVIMNNTTTTMTFKDKATEVAITTGDPVDGTYSFEAPAGEYLLTGIDSDGATENGAIVVTVPESDEVTELKILTITAYASNKDDDGTLWTIENGDYNINLTVSTREGVHLASAVKPSTTAGRYTFLTLNGNTAYVEFAPAQKRIAEGYVAIELSRTLTWNATISTTIPKGGDLTVTAPADAIVQIGRKTAHFIEFKLFEPLSVETQGENKVYTYHFAQGQQFNYRVMLQGKLTRAGYTSLGENTAMDFTADMFEAMKPTDINHDVQSNRGYETGDIFVNINPQGYLSLNAGDTYTAHAMRTWELTDTQTNNYFMEPDFHYSIVGLDGQPLSGVLEIEQNPGSAWATIKAVGAGTAIVLVTYDAIGLPDNWMGGPLWGAIWPENTAAYVVTVGQTASAAVPNMVINEEYNQGAKKLAGKYVDAEHDVFYYLDTEAGATYTFKPENVASVTMSYPTIGQSMASYTGGFGTEGVTLNADGSYTLLLKEGRQIVRLEDAAGRATYQVLTAKRCHREITNITRPSANDFQPGDKITIQFSGLRHPANKLAGIYNMSAYVTYNGVPNGSSLILGSGQYTFGSAASAQAVSVEIPMDYDVTANPEMVLDKGVIQVNGYGDPIGAHRDIDPQVGRSPNFTAVAHKTYFGFVPATIIPVSPLKLYSIRIECNVAGAVITVTHNGETLTPNAEGIYTGTSGLYSVEATAEGYPRYNQDFTIADDADIDQTFNVVMEYVENLWDGTSTSEPALENGYYLISTGAEMAWFGNHVNEGNLNINGRLVADIHLGGHDWDNFMPGWKQEPYSGTFEGDGHAIRGLSLSNGGGAGLFGAVSGTVRGVEVYGNITVSTGNVGAITGYALENCVIDRCVSHVNIKCTGRYANNAGGIAAVADPNSSITNCYNTGNLSAQSYVGGIVGYLNAEAKVENVYSTGVITAINTNYGGSCFGKNTPTAIVSNAFSTKEYAITTGTTLVTEEQMASGEIAYRLGEAFGQKIGTDPYPVLDGAPVYYDETTGTYSNSQTGVENVEVSCNGGQNIYYNAQGVASERPFRGLNIVRHPDGTVTKEYIR